MLWQIVVISALLAAPVFGTTETTTAAPAGATTAAGSATTAAPRCTDASGNLLPPPRAALNETNDCASVFKTPAVASPASRDPMCDMPLLADTALKCSKTCAICCENPNYSCGDAKGYEALCPTWKNTCGSTVPQVRDQMARLCAGTCGLCMQSSCKDALPDCFKQAVLCNDITAGPIWQQQCARTCGTCPSTPSPNPSPNPSQPNPPAPAPGPSGDCGDTRSCASFVSKGFCTDTWYTMDFRRKTCGRSCGFC